MRTQLLIVAGSLLIGACARCPCTPLEVCPDLPATTVDADLTTAPSGPHYRVTARFTRVAAGCADVVRSQSAFVRPGRSVAVDASTRTSFVQDYDIEASGDAFLADPIVGILSHGVALDFAAAPAAAVDDTAHVAYRVTVAALSRLRARRVRWSRHGAEKIQLPVMDLAEEVGARYARHDTDVQLVDMPAPDGQGRVRVHVRVTAVGDVATEAAKPAADAPAAAPPAPTEPDLGLPLLPGPSLVEMLAAATSEGAQAGGLRIRFVALPNSPPLSKSLGTAGAQSLVDNAARTYGTLNLASTSVAGSNAKALRQLSYLQDYDARGPLRRRKTPHGILEESRHGVYDPIVGTILAGMAAGVRTHEGRQHLELIFSQLLTPIPDFTTTLAEGLTVTIELPELRLVHARVDLETGRVTSEIGGAAPIRERVDLGSGTALLVFGKTIIDDEVYPLAAWIERRDAAR